MSDLKMSDKLTFSTYSFIEGEKKFLNWYRCQFLIFFALPSFSIYVAELSYDLNICIIFVFELPSIYDNKLFISI